MKTMLLLLIGTVSLLAQSTFTASRETTLSSAAEVITIQVPGTLGNQAQKQIRMLSVSIVCAVACDATLERDGTAATATALTVTGVNRIGASATAAAYRSSDVGVGTVLSKYSLAAGGLYVFDLSAMRLNPGENTSLRTSSISGKVQIVYQWEEK